MRDGGEGCENCSAVCASGLHCRWNPFHAMPVAQLTLEIRIEHAQSLKDRRQVVRSLKDQLRQGFNVSVAEMDEAVTWQSATIGVVAAPVLAAVGAVAALVSKCEVVVERTSGE